MKAKYIFFTCILFTCAGLVFSSLLHGWLSWLNAILCCNLVVLVALYARNMSFLKELMLMSGADNGATRDTEAAIREQVARSHSVGTEMKHAIAGIDHIGQNNFTGFVEELKDHGIRQALLTTHEKIVQIRTKEQESNWITQGVATIAGLKYKGNDLADYSYQVISTVIKYSSANQGAFFILQGDEADDEHFFLIASYAYGKKKYIEKRINLGEGLVGQMYYEKEINLLTDVPEDFIRITSGLGEALPRCVCIVPLLSDGKILGALEIISFKKLQDFEIEYLKKIGENIGYNLSAMETSRKTEKLLQESRKMAQEVKSQEEELRQNMEELKSTQETMLREREKLETLSLVANNTNNSVIIADRDGRIIYVNEGFMRLTGYGFDEVNGKKPGSFLQGPLTDKDTVARISGKLRTGEALYEEILNYKKSGEIYWASVVINPIKNSNGRVEKFISVQADITETKKISLDFQAKLTSISKTNVIIEFNARGEVAEANDFFFQIMEFSKANIIGKPYHALIPEEDQAKPQTKLMWESIFGGQSFTGEFRLVDSRGRIQWLSGSYNPVRDLNGHLERVMMLGQFVTTDKEKVNRLHQVLESIDACVPIVELNSNLTFKTANQAFLSETGLKRLELKKLSLPVVFGEPTCREITRFLHNGNASVHLPLSACINEKLTLTYKATLFKIEEDREGERDTKVLLVLKNL